MNSYYLLIDTDGDFGLESYNGFKIYEEMRMKASSKKSLKDFVNSLYVFDIYPDQPMKRKIGEDFLWQLKEQVKTYDQGNFGGNCSFEFGPIKQPEYDLYI